jgi:hypothetical protein
MKERTGIIIFSVLAVILSIFWGIFVKTMHWPFTVWVAGEIIAIIFMAAIVMASVFFGSKRA